MKRPHVERFITDFERNPAVAQEFTALGDDPEGWVRLAQVKGYELTLDEARGLASGYRELSDDELEEVAGGWDGTGGSGGSGSSGGGGG